MFMFDVVRDTKYTPFSSMDIHLLVHIFILFYFYLFLFFGIFYLFRPLLHFIRLYSEIFNETQQMMCFFSSSCHFSVSRTDSLHVLQIVPFLAINKHQEKYPWVWCLMKYYYERLNVVCDCVCEFAVQKALWMFTIFIFLWNKNSSQLTKRSKGKNIFASKPLEERCGKRKTKRKKAEKKNSKCKKKNISKN